MRKKLLITLSAVILLSLLGCSKGGNEKVNQVNKANNEAKVENKKNSITTVDLSKFNIKNSEDEKSGVMFKPQDTNDSWKLKFKKFTGVHTMSKFKLSKDESVTLQCNSKVESGKLILLVLDKNSDVIKSLDGNKEETIEVKAKEVEEYTVKVVGDEATEGEVVVKFK